MTEDQITAIERSFPLLVPIAEPAATLFYAKLFARDPALRPLFARTDAAGHGRDLMQAIGFVVAHLRRPEAMLPALAEFGRRQGRRGVQPAHYVSAAAALLETLAARLGPDFTPALREAWAAAYGLVAETMIRAAEPVRAAA
jgi:hemoglobin-like flavoprotein